MESCPKASAAGDGVLQAEHLHLPVLSAATLLGDSNGCGLSEFFLDQYTEVDVSSEWLSSFVEDCLSSAGNCLPPSKDYQNLTTTTNPNSSITKPHNKEPFSSRNLTKTPIPGKPRSQRGRKANSSKAHKNPKFRWPDQSFQNAFSDPPLLEQAYWLADSELLATPMKKEEESREEKCGDGDKTHEQEQEQQQQARRCSHCQAQRTPQWRAGPMGPKTLCNACGMRYFKSGRLLPEYRPAKSPTFVSFKHSNSHKKVLQMRMGMVSSSTPVWQ